MSEDGSVSEDFSVSGDEWKPRKNTKEGGESSDDDDSEFDGFPIGRIANKGSDTRKKAEPKSSGVQKKIFRKRVGLSLRSKGCKKHWPQSSAPDTIRKNSTRASSSGTNSRNIANPDENKSSSRNFAAERSGSSSDSSIYNYLVKPEDLDFQSSFFNVEKNKTSKRCSFSDVSISDMDSNNGKDGSRNVEKAFDFSNLLEHAKSEELVRETVAEQNAAGSNKRKTNFDAMDVYAALTLGEGKIRPSNEEVENCAEALDDKRSYKIQSSKLCRTKSRTKRQTKTRFPSTRSDTDDSEWEEVPDSSKSVDSTVTRDKSSILQICVELPTLNRERKTHTQQDIENAFKRKLNRDIKERQVLLHKASLLYHFGRIFFYNRLLNNPILMHHALKILPRKSAYPPEEGTEIKYFQSMVTWFKTAVKLSTQRLYPEKSAGKKKSKIVVDILKQIQKKYARSKQDMVFIFIILLRGMGLQCRLIVNMQPISLKPSQSDLLAIKLKRDDESKEKFLECETDTYLNGSKVKYTEKKSIAKDHEKTSPDRSCQNEKKRISRDNKSSSKNKNISPSQPHHKLKNINVKNLENCKKQNKKDVTNKSKEEYKSTFNKSDDNETKSLHSNIKVSNITKEENDEYKNVSEDSSNLKPNKAIKIRIKNPKIAISGQNDAKQSNPQNCNIGKSNRIQELNSSKKENETEGASLLALTHLNRIRQEEFHDKKCGIEHGSAVIPKVIAHAGKDNATLIITDFSENPVNGEKNLLLSRQKTNKTQGHYENVLHSKQAKLKRSNLRQLKVPNNTENSSEDFEPSSSKKNKFSPTVTTQNRRVVSSADETEKVTDIWIEVWCDIEEQWVCADIFNAKIHCVDDIRKSSSPSMAYVFAFQNDLSIKDVTARYCTNWTTVIRKLRVDKAWLDTSISKYLGHRTKHDITEDHILRRIHEEKPMPTTIGDYKNHPFYVLERHLLKFEALYPSDAPALRYIRGEPVYSRNCVHTLHSRDIWLKQARVVKMGENPYKIVKARPKWDKITQTLIKDQPLEIFGYWQTEDYEPPTAENGLVPRNAYGNVELFKPSMLPKKTKHIRLPGLNRICKKLKIDCANAVVGFDFHQGTCHPTFDGFIVCEEFADQVIAAWHQDQQEQEHQEQKKYEIRVFRNWKKLIRGLLIRQHLKLKYNLET